MNFKIKTLQEGLQYIHKQNHLSVMTSHQAEERDSETQRSLAQHCTNTPEAAQRKQSADVRPNNSVIQGDSFLLVQEKVKPGSEMASKKELR